MDEIYYPANLFGLAMVPIRTFLCRPARTVARRWSARRAQA
jgi:hypothetical protein